MHHYKSHPTAIAHFRNLFAQRAREIFHDDEDAHTLPAQAVIDPHDGEAIYAGWDALRDRWATLNNVSRTDSEITLDGLVRGLAFGGRWGAPYDWPEARWACDHPSHFKRDGRAAAIAVEPYEARDFDELLAYAPTIGLVAHTPPNPKASFWSPGHTRLVVLTSPTFGEVKWLPDQLAFESSSLESGIAARA
jgi:hypothetical protein